MFCALVAILDKNLIFLVIIFQKEGIYDKKIKNFFFSKMGKIQNKKNH